MRLVDWLVLAAVTLRERIEGGIFREKSFYLNHQTKGGRCTHAPAPYPNKPTFADLLSYHLYENYASDVRLAAVAFTTYKNRAVCFEIESLQGKPTVSYEINLMTLCFMKSVSQVHLKYATTNAARRNPQA